MNESKQPQSSIILYQTEDGRTRIQCRFEDETVWLTQKLMADLFQIGVGTVNHHLKAIFAEGELQAAATIRRYRIVKDEGVRQIIRKEDVSIAKNYLDAEELGTLNRIVNAYIEFAELRALQRKVMTMRDWITKLDEFLKLSEHELLDHSGRISAEQARMKAELEYDRYRKLTDEQPRPVDADFDMAMKQLQKPAPKPRKKLKP